VVLDVLDDGPGFDPAVLDEPAEGHFGLRVLADLASDAGATLQVASAPGAGTHWRLAIVPGHSA
jgi:signal transduction histidine kinase